MLSRAEIKRLRTLKRRRGREEAGLFLVEGVRLVEDLLASPVVLRRALLAPSVEDTPRGAALAQRLRAAAVDAVDVPEHQLAEVADTEAPQGVVAVAELPVHVLPRELPERALCVLLDGVQDPGNFGTIVRSADAFGAAFVCALPGTVDPWNPKAVRAAAGSSLRVPVIETGVQEAFTWLRARQFRILGADMHGTEVTAAGVAPRTALVMGNEGAGLGAELRELLDGTVAVPIRGSAESLNVGVAAGILLFTLSRGL